LVLLLYPELLAFEFLDLQSFPLTGCLGRGAIPENSFNAALLFFIFRLCSFPA
jgi:hypothetical protein